MLPQRSEKKAQFRDTSGDSVIELTENPNLKEYRQPDSDDEHDHNDNESEIQDDDQTEKSVHAPLGSNRAWWRLHPLLRALVLIVTVGGVLATPAIVVGVLYREHLEQSMRDADEPYYTKLKVVRWFTWLAIIWVLGVLVFHLVLSIPSLVLTVAKKLTGGQSEKLRTRLEYFNAASLYVKLTLTCMLALLSFSVVFPNARPTGDSTFADKEPESKAIFNVIACLFIASVMFFVEKVLLQMIATRFHATAYRERLRDLKYGLWVIDTLEDARRRGDESNNSTFTPFAWTRRGNRESTADFFAPGDPRSRAGSNAGSQVEHKGTGTPALIQPFNMIANTMRNVGKQAINADVDINSNSRARRLAKKLFDALQGTRDYLTMQDFIPYFRNTKEASKAFELFDKDHNGDVTKKEMRAKIMAIYKERRDLNSSLRDMSQIVGKLDKIMIVICVILIAIFSSMVFGQNPASTLVSFGTLFVGWSFIFGATLKNMFECLIFLFITHPYDAGDLVVINGITMTVTKVRVLSTIFTRGDGQYVVAPNSALLNLFINNLRRSPPQSETITVNFDFYTPETKLDQLKERLDHFLDQFPRIFEPGVGFSVDSVIDAHKIAVNLSLSYKANWQNGAPRAEGRNKFMVYLRNCMMDLDIRCFGLTQPVQLQGPPPRYDDLGSDMTPPTGPHPDGDDSYRRRPRTNSDEDPLHRSGSTMYDRAPGGNAGSSSGTHLNAGNRNGQNAQTDYTAAGIAAASTGLIAANVFGF
ncbi:hypothetical protein IWQ60_000856 [Tieghemiomyces parasiticus]|uniref:EF-hand domain-containing protein n=1 Tax=Tieghemiomyces parasiticus TaxID=78921 RepID=A0A9W8AE36_9FUNG|nr:hypothetical protein IWQ60_000856 [Tieghemiomyces parasiticus]